MVHEIIKKGFYPIALMGISKKKERPKETMKLRMRWNF